MVQQQNNLFTEHDGNTTGLHCPTCDYDLTGLQQNRCPECGSAFDPAGLRSYKNWDGRHRSVVGVLFVASMMLFLFRLSCFLLKNQIIPNRTSRPGGYHNPVVGFVVQMGEMIPWFAHALTVVISVVLFFMAASANAPKSALVAFVAVLVSLFGFVLQWSMIVNGH